MKKRKELFNLTALTIAFLGRLCMFVQIATDTVLQNFTMTIEQTVANKFAAPAVVRFPVNRSAD